MLVTPDKLTTRQKPLVGMGELVVRQIAFIGIIPAPLPQQRPSATQPAAQAGGTAGHACSPSGRLIGRLESLSRNGDTDRPAATRPTV